MGGGEYEYEYEYGVPNTNIFTNILVNEGYTFLTLPTFGVRTDAYLPLYVGYTSVRTRQWTGTTWHWSLEPVIAGYNR